MLHEGDRKRLFSFLIAFPVTLKRRLRGERDIGELASVLAQVDIEKLQVSNNMPRYCLEVINTYIMEAGKHENLFPQIFIDRMLAYMRILSMCMNKSERIREYSVNYGYLAHLRMFIALWLVLLPYSLVEYCGWTTIVLCPFIAFGILGMEQVAEELSQPFVSYAPPCEQFSVLYGFQRSDFFSFSHSYLPFLLSRRVTTSTIFQLDKFVTT